MVKKIVLITTGQPSLNPRIVKEADALQNAGFEVMVLYCFFIKWATEKDKVLLKNAKWKYKLVGGSPINGKYYYLYTRVRIKILQILNRWIGNRFLFAERIQARAYDKLLSEAKKIKADWYIGHNLGALAVAVKAATFNQAKAGFDFEDYHRGENSPIIKNDLQRITFLENKYVSFLHYFSSASVLITEATKKNHLNFKGDILTLLNCFPLTQQPIYKKKYTNDKVLKLFWFSQTIGANRGLEALIKALNYLDDKSINLTLVGKCNEDMLIYFKVHGSKIFENIHFAGIIQPEELPYFSAQFDVGLALETGFSENNDIALSNKILTYLLAGNAVILSDTSMQNNFNIKYQIGESFAINDIKQLAHKIGLYKDFEFLNKQKLYNYQLASSTLNWENEFKKLLVIFQ